MNLVVLSENKISGKALSEAVNAPLVERLEDGDVALCRENNILKLKGMGMEFYGDFENLRKRLVKCNLNSELLVKAVKIKSIKEPLKVVDATAGMGEDSFLLAAFGFSVELFEYNPVIYALLKDSIERGEKQEDIKEILSRMKLSYEDCIQGLKKLSYPPDVVYLDPMFPKKQKNNLIKKKFQLIHKLEMPCGNEEELLNAARLAKPKKIVIKRPLKGPFLAGVKPNYSIFGKSVRYDCIQ